MLRLPVMVVAVGLSAGVLTLSASAATVPGSPIPLVNQSSASNVQLAAHRNVHRRVWVYNRRAHGPRFAYRHGRYRYYYGGWWYPRPWWYGPGSSFAGNPISGWWDDFDWAEGGYTEDTDPHVEWCFDHYHSYEEATDSFLGHDGAPHRCRSPFD
jgi:hypothetical protein